MKLYILSPFSDEEFEIRDISCPWGDKEPVLIKWKPLKCKRLGDILSQRLALEKNKNSYVYHFCIDLSELLKSFASMTLSDNVYYE